MSQDKTTNQEQPKVVKVDKAALQASIDEKKKALQPSQIVKK